jgi:hypothetical protein
MSTFDATKPLTTDNYSTVFVPTLQGNFASLAFGLDPTYVTAYGTLSTGMQRLNRTGTGLWEFWNGSAWAAVATGYIRRDGSNTFTGSVGFGVTPSTWSLVGSYYGIELGTVGNGLFVGNNDVNVMQGLYYNGAWTRSSTGATGLYQLNLGIHRFYTGTAGTAGTTAGLTQVVQIDSTGITTPQRILTTLNSEAIRMQGDAIYFAGWNSANSLRTGYIQFNTANNVSLVAENGASLYLGSSGTIRWNIDTTGQLLGQPLNSYIGHNGTTGSLAIGANGTLADSTARIELYDTAHATVPKQIAYRADVHTWTKAGAGTGLMVLDGSGNLSVTASLVATAGVQAGSTTGFLSTSYAGNQQNPIWRFGNALLYGFSYFQGSSGIDGTNDTVGFHFGTATAAGSILAISGSGAAKGIVVTGAATTKRFAIGSQATITVNWAQSNYQTMTLTANVAAAGWIFTNQQDGQTITLKITQDATGGRTIAANSSIKWPGGILGVLSTAANAVDIMVLTYDAGTGFFYATLAKGFA